MSHWTNRFLTAAVTGAATGIAAGFLGVLAGGYWWALIFMGPFISGALIVWNDHTRVPGVTVSAVIKGAAAGLLAGILSVMALPAYLALWQEVSLATVYNPVYWLSHQAEVSDEIGSRAGWCAILGSVFTGSSMTAGAFAGMLMSLVPRTPATGPKQNVRPRSRFLKDH